jgi:transcriptional regulator with XRE-family HTH domain
MLRDGVTVLERRRAELGLSVRRAAALAGVTPQTWRQVERYARRPHLTTLARIARVLEMPLVEVARALNQGEQEGGQG